MHYIFRPNIPGELGDKTEGDFTKRPIIINHLHFVFDYFPDDIFTCCEVIVVIENLLNIILDNNLTGLSTPKLIEYELNQQYFVWENSDDVPNKNYFMMEVCGNVSDDFYLTKEFNLIISEKALELLKSFRISFAKWEEFKG